MTDATSGKGGVGIRLYVSGGEVAKRTFDQVVATLAKLGETFDPAAPGLGRYKLIATVIRGLFGILTYDSWWSLVLMRESVQ